VAPRDRGLHPSPALLWAAAVLVALAVTAWQRVMEPTHPHSGDTLVEERSVPWTLRTSGLSGEPLRVEIEAPPAVLTGTLRWRPFPSGDAFDGISMLRQDDRLVALLPNQPPGGRVEYYLVLAGRFGLVRVPEDEPVVLRFKGRVPRVVLVPHVVLLFLTMAFALRAGLGAVFARPDTLWLSWATLGGLTLGGMVLGPIVQKLAFDAFWMGWPVGDDLTGDKTFVAWLFWIVAVLALRGARSAADRFARTTTVAATVATLAIFLVPNSLGGGPLGYSQLDPGTPPWEAVTTGR
jgi:hypothetical protein